MISLGALVLAAGRGRRMGGPKALLRIEGGCFLTAILDTLLDAGIEPVRVVLGAHAQRVRDALGLPEDLFVLNPRADEGMITSILRGLHDFRPPPQGILVWPVDHPRVGAGTIRSLAQAFGESQAPVTVPRYRGRHGHPVIFSAAVYPELARAVAEGAHQVVRARADTLREVPVEDEGVVDEINTPEDYRRVFGASPTWADRK